MSEYPLIQYASNMPAVSLKEYEYIQRISQLEVDLGALQELIINNKLIVDWSPIAEFDPEAPFAYYWVSNIETREVHEAYSRRGKLWVSANNWEVNHMTHFAKREKPEPPR